MNYYFFKLNNAYELATDDILPYPHTVAKNIITKELSSLTDLEATFMGLDDTITENMTTYTVKGSFPIVAIKKEDKIYDVITGKEIKYSKDHRDVNGLSFSEIYRADRRLVEMLLANLSETEKQAYIAYLERLEEYCKKVFFLNYFEEDYYLFTPVNIRIDAPKVLARDVNGTLVEVVTNKSFYEIDYKTVSLHLGYYDKYQVSQEYAREYALYILEEGITEYIGRIEEAERNSISKYYNYVSSNIIKDIKTRKLTK